MSKILSQTTLAPMSDEKPSKFDDLIRKVAALPPPKLKKNAKRKK
jgi:hypothetical protein